MYLSVHSVVETRFGLGGTFPACRPIYVRYPRNTYIFVFLNVRHLSCEIESMIETHVCKLQMCECECIDSAARLDPGTAQAQQKTPPPVRP